MNYLNSYIKFLSRNKLYTFINVFGLSLSLMFVILIANHTIEEHSTDNFQENAEQIYVLGSEQYGASAYRIGGRLESLYPEIEKSCAIVPILPGVINVKVPGGKSAGECIAVDSTFFNMFSFELKQGDKNNVFASKNNMVISERFAKKVFGDSDPLGQNIIISDNLSYTITGVVEDFDNSIIKYADMIIHIENMVHFNSNILLEDMRNAAGVVMFLQIVKGADITSKTSDMLEYFKECFWIYKKGIWKNVTLTPIKEMYFNEVSMFFLNKGDKGFTNMLLVVGILILVFAVLNYINLTVAQTGFRAKEVSMRRLLGASKHAIFIRMIVESMLLCVVAFLIGLFLAAGLESYANNLIGGSISIFDNLSAIWIISYIVLVVSLGFVSGIFPALVISQFKPIDVVRGSFTLKSKMTYSKVFITIQAMITTVLIGCSITILEQVEHLMNADLGYNQKGIISITMWGSFKNENQLKLFRERLRALPIVENVGLTTGMPVGGNSLMMTVDGIEDMISFQERKRDSTAMKILEIETIEDRQIAEDGVWLNETAMRMIGADKDTRSFKDEYDNQYIIKGVVKDYVLGDALTEGKLRPLLLTIKEDIDPWAVLVEVNGDPISAFKEIEKVFKDVTDGRTFDAQFVDQQIAERYEVQKKTSTIMMIFTFIAIIISSLGLLAMAAYFIQQRSKEIAVRKVFGSTTPQVLKKLIWQFLRLVIIAFVIACPIIWYAMSEWLQDFPYRIELSVWIFILAGIFTLSISFITVFWQSSVAANANPVDSIKR